MVQTCNQIKEFYFFSSDLIEGKHANGKRLDNWTILFPGK